MEIVEKAGKLLGSCDEIMLASVSAEGYPRACVLSRTKSEGIRKVYAATGAIGEKVRHFKANPKASVCFYQGGDSVTLVGRVTVRQDRAIKEEMWLDWFDNHFAGIDDPNYCILEFETTVEATLWIGGEFVTLPAGEI